MEISEEHESKQKVLIGHLDEFEKNPDSDRDELLEILSSKCGLRLSGLSLTELTAEQLQDILAGLDKLLFDEWIEAPPSLGTLLHARVFITELCALSLETTEELPLQGITDQLQSLVESISQLAGSVPESFLLTQALYLNLMHYFNNGGRGDSDATLIAKRWAAGDVSAEELLVLEFLGTLTSSLQNAVGKASVFILDMELQCLELLLSTLTQMANFVWDG